MSTLPLYEGQNLADATVDMTVKQIGRGGFSEVAMGPDQMQGLDWIALKTLQSRFLQDDSVRQAFILEALTWIGLWDNANILDAQFVSEIGGVPFLHLDYAENGSLRDTLPRISQFSLDNRIWWGQHIAAGLDFLHTTDDSFLHRAFAHRDVKPENILILGNNIAQIADFGLSKIVPASYLPDLDEGEPLDNPGTLYNFRSGDQRASGTPAYLAPELWGPQGNLQDNPPFKADIYALGLILCELVTGKHAYFDTLPGHSLNEWRVAHQYATPRSLRAVQPRLPTEIEAIYERCLAKDEDQRPTASEVLKEISTVAGRQGWLTHQRADATPRTEPYNWWVFWHNWALAYDTFGYYDLALDRIQRARRIDPEAYASLIAYGRILQRLDRAYEGMEVFAGAASMLDEPPDRKIPKRRSQRNRLFETAMREQLSIRAQQSRAASQRMAQPEAPHPAEAPPQEQIRMEATSPITSPPGDLYTPDVVGMYGAIDAVPPTGLVTPGQIINAAPGIIPAIPRIRPAAPPAFEQTFRIGDTLTDYTSIALTVESIASGGFGIVAFGRDEIQHRWFALKTMRPDVLRRSPQVRDLFIRESLTWLGIWPHANILQAHYLTEINGLPVLVLEFAEQGSLRRILGPSLAPDTALRIAQHIAAGLAHVHTPDPAHLRPEPLVHRDLKPENVLLHQVDSDLLAQITDFGLAKTQAAIAEAELLDDSEDDDDPTRSQRIPYRTRRGVAMGTPAYMAPEQWEDAASAGPAADMYAFGIMLGELLVGDHPLLALHQRHTMEEWRQAHVSGQHRPLPSVFPLPLQYLYNALLSPDPRQRPTAPETLARLQDIARRIQLTIYEPSDLVASTVENQGVYWMNWAIAYTRFDRYGEALERIEHAYALHPQDPDVILNRANVLLGLRRHEEGLVAFDAALAAVPSENHQQRKAILNNKGALFNRIERFAEAEAAYQNAIKEMPDAADTWRNRARNALDWSIAEAKAGVVASAHNLVRQAAAFARQTATLNPSMRRLSILLENVALAFNQFDLYQEAEDMFAFAVTFARESSTLFYNRAINALEWDEQVRAEGDAATAQARLQSALSYVQEAIRLAPQESDYARLAERIRSLLAQ